MLFEVTPCSLNSHVDSDMLGCPTFDMVNSRSFRSSVSVSAVAVTGGWKCVELSCILHPYNKVTSNHPHTSSDATQSAAPHIMTHAKTGRRQALEVARQCQTTDTLACKLMHARAPSHHTTTRGKHFEETAHTQNTANSTLSRATEVWAAPTRVHNGTGGNPGTRALPRRTSCHHVSKTHTFLCETRGSGFDSLPHSQFHQTHLNDHSRACLPSCRRRAARCPPPPSWH